MTDELRMLLDGTLGKHARSFAYASLLKNRAAFDKLLTYGEGISWRMAWGLIGGCFSNVLKKNMALEDEAHMASVYKELDEGMERLGTWLAGLATPFFGGDQPGTADVAIAAILAPCIIPPMYCRGKFNEIWGLWLSQDTEAQARVDGWRGTPIGKHILLTYETCRMGLPN